MALNFPENPTLGKVETIDGVVWVCDDATVGNVRWVRRGSAIGESMPIGSFLSHGGTTPPPGYLACDASEKAQADYPDLFAAIANNWATTGGAASPAVGNFRLPPHEIDGLGLYLRGDGSGTVVGEYQADVFKEHGHLQRYRDNPTAEGTESNVGRQFIDGGVNFDGALTALTGDPIETRPRSITTLLCIKATFSSYTGDLGNVPVNSVGSDQTVGPSTTFTTTDGKTITVVDGLITTVV